MNTGYVPPPGTYVQTCGQKYIMLGSGKNGCAPSAGRGGAEGYSDIFGLGPCAEARVWFQELYQTTKGKDYFPMGDAISETDAPANCFYQNAMPNRVKTIVYNSGDGGNTGTYAGLYGFRQLCKFTAGCCGDGICQDDEKVDGCPYSTCPGDCADHIATAGPTCPPEQPNDGTGACYTAGKRASGECTIETTEAACNAKEGLGCKWASSSGIVLLG